LRRYNKALTDAGLGDAENLDKLDKTRCGAATEHLHTTPALGPRHVIHSVVNPRLRR
jgi:hypothetical protein